MKPKEHSWPQYIRNGIGLKLSKIGEQLGLHALTYNPVIMELFHSIAVQNAPKVIRAMREAFPNINSVIDVGCGSGAFAAEFNKLGIKAIGLEHSKHGVKLARSLGVDCRPFDASEENQLTEKADLVYSFEVAEHLPMEFAERFVRIMSSFGSCIVFAAAQPRQGGIGHINEQPLSYWIEKFEQLGFTHSVSESLSLRKAFQDHGTSDWFHRNTCVFRRQ